MEITVRVDGSEVLPAGTLHLLPRSSSDLADSETLPMQRELAPKLEVELESDRIWELRVDAEGYWAAPLLHVPGEKQESLTLTLHRTTSIVGRLRLPEDPERGAASLGIRFRATGSRGGALEGEVPCALETVALETGDLETGDLEAASNPGEAPLRDHLFDCRVPAATLDLRLRTPGFVSRFLWGQALAVDEPLDLGLWQPAPGASLVGWIETEEGKPPGKDCTLALWPRIGPQSPPEEHAKARLHRLSVKPDSRGFFHFEGVQEGNHVLLAEMEGYAPLQLGPIPVQAEKEAELAEPLVLVRPLDLSIRIVPSLDLDEGRWAFVLLEYATDVVVETGRADDEGVWRLPGVTPGMYRLAISDSKGRRMGFQEIEFAPGATEFSFELAFAEIAGRVTLGGEPLGGATLYFGGEHGSTRKQLETDEEGLFAGTLPEDALPRLDIHAADPMVRRRFRRVEPENEADGSLWLEIDLPDTRIHGRVVDEFGEGVEEARILSVLVGNEERVATLIADKEGYFVQRGSAPGLYRLEALAFLPGNAMLKSQLEELELDETSGEAEIELVVLRQAELKGIVRSAAGPVGGAQLVISPIARQGTPDFSLYPQGSSELDGRFDIQIPSGLREAEITVMAPGFMLHKRRFTVDDHEMEIFVQEGGGNLIVELEEPLWGEAASEANPWIVRDGIMRHPLGILLTWARRNGVVQQPDRLSVPALEPGHYAVCQNSPNPETKDCPSGFLNIGETLVLPLESPETSEQMDDRKTTP